MATFKPFKATDKFSMQTFNDKFEEVVADFNADNLKIDTALNQKRQLPHRHRELYGDGKVWADKQNQFNF